MAVEEVSVPTTGFVLPTASGILAGSGTWTLPGNITANDGTEATFSLAVKNTTGRWAVAEIFGLLSIIPVGATIDQVNIRSEWRVNNAGGIGILEMQAFVSGASVGAVRANSAEPTTLTTSTFDITADRAWTRADFADGTFEILIRGRNGNSATDPSYRWDHVAVEVVYTESASPSEVTLTPAVMAFSAVAITASQPASEVTLTPAVLAFSAVAVSPSSGPTEVTLTPAVMAFSAPALSPSSGPTEVTLTSAVLAFSAVPLAFGAAPSEVTLTPAVIAFSAVAPGLMIPLAQLEDDFEDGSLDTGLWEQIAGTVTEAGGELELDNATTYAVVRSNPFVDATESEVLAEWTMYTGVATGSAQSGFKLFRGDGATYGHVQIMRHNVDSIQISKTEDNVSIFAESITYSATNHKWLRIRFTATQVIFEASADGTNWTQPWTNSVSALPTWALNDGVKVEMFAGYFNAGQPDPGSTFVDNFNIPPSQVTLTPAVLAFSAPAVTPASGPTEVTLTPAVIAFSAVPLTFGGAAPSEITLIPAVLAFTGVALAPSAGPTEVTLTPAVVNFSAVPLVLPVVASEVTLTAAMMQFEPIALVSVGAPLQKVDVRPRRSDFLRAFPVRYRDTPRDRQ
jgi:hypothetical protein